MKKYDWTGWSKWMSFADQQEANFADAPREPGAYAIAIDRPLNRAVGTDNLGLLTIGESDSLRRRLRDFTKCATTYNKGGHMAGWRFSFFRLERNFPIERLRIRWKAAATKADAYELEGRMLLNYLAIHSELPPLNYSFNWSPFAKDGDDLFDVMIGLKKPPKILK